MNWDDETRDGLDIALNEADVLGVRVDPAADVCDLLLHVLALPSSGPLDPDARRILRLFAPSQVRVLLRRDLAGPEPSPVVPLADLAEVESFFALLSWCGSMYGWKFLDDATLTKDWPKKPSLTIEYRARPARHSLYWFNECGRAEDGAPMAYVIEGTVTFDDLAVLRADGTAQPTAEFIADGRRHWEALHDGDERLSPDAQSAAQDGTPKWRVWSSATGCD